jgi:hypothetical protein
MTKCYILRTQSECSSMSEINKVDAVMFSFCRYSFSRGWLINVRYYRKKPKRAQHIKIMWHAVTDSKYVKQKEMEWHRNQLPYRDRGLYIRQVFTGLNIVIDRVNKTFHIEIDLWQAWVQLHTVGLFVVTGFHTRSKPTWLAI